MAEVVTETTPSKPDFTISKPRLLLLLASPILFPVAIYAISQWATKKLPHDPSVPYGENVTMFADKGSELLDGQQLYMQHCANCHGVRGDGNGVALLNTRARYFGGEKYKFASTTNAMPTDADLHRILQRGIPGSPMPEFPQFSEAQRNALIGHIRNLTWKGTYDRLMAKAIKDYDDGGDTPDPEKIASKASKECTLGDTIKIPDLSSRADSLEKGKVVFTKICAACHGPEGAGDGPQAKDPKFINENGTRAYPRNLTLGIYKGGGEPEQIYKRVFAGIPGSPMPASGATMKPEELVDVMHFVKSLVK